MWPVLRVTNPDKIPRADKAVEDDEEIGEIVNNLEETDVRQNKSEEEYPAKNKKEERRGWRGARSRAAD